MIRLLRREFRSGYPIEWLLAALRGRSQRPAQRSAMAERALAATQRRWMYAALEPGWRRRYAAAFVWFELPGLLVALRQLAGRERTALGHLVETSLWPPVLLAELEAAADLPAAADRLERRWLPVLPGIAGLGQGCRRVGARGMEEQLGNAFFAALPAQPLTPELRRFFAELRTLRNLLTLQRLARWNLRRPDALYPGPWPLDRRLASSDPLRRQQALRQRFGTAVETPEDLERAVLNRLSRDLQRHERQDPRGALLLNALWREQLRLRAAGLRQWAGDEVAAWEASG